MAGFLGEISCKLDSKGRLSVPAKLLKRMPPEHNDRFIINRGLDACLTLYTVPEWNKVTEKIQQLNHYNAQHRKFIRYFFRGADELNIDANNRILLPKNLMEYASVNKEVVLLGSPDRIEIWAKDVLNEHLNVEPEEFSDLAGKVMGTNPPLI